MSHRVPACGWRTECLPLLHRTQHAVVQALGYAQLLLPFTVLGLDTDNGSEFINEVLLEYCERYEISFTRGRVAKKNDQCFVEQKNGSVVRQLVGYDRFEGEQAYCQLAELYRAVRLYVNFFQPSMKLKEKAREGSKVRRRYDEAATPYQRLLGCGVLEEHKHDRLEGIYKSLDPVLLLQQIQVLQDALWKHAVLGSLVVAQQGETVRFDIRGQAPVTLDAGAEGEANGRRKYRRTKQPSVPRWWRTRKDPFEEVWEQVEGWLQVSPERTAKSLFEQLQREYPGRFPDVQLRTLQRRVREWRERALVEFHDQWLREDLLAGQMLPPQLRASTEVQRPPVETQALSDVHPQVVLSASRPPQ